MKHTIRCSEQHRRAMLLAFKRQHVRHHDSGATIVVDVNPLTIQAALRLPFRIVGGGYNHDCEGGLS